MYPRACLAPVGVIAVAVLVELATVSSVGLGQTVCDSIGPDGMVGEIVGVDNFSSSGGIEAFAVGTTWSNIGDAELLSAAGRSRRLALPLSAFVASP